MKRKYKDKRHKDLAIIHTAKKTLGLNDDTYRDFLYSQTGKRSAADLKSRERAKVIAELERLGGQTAPRPRSRVTPSDDKARLVHEIEKLLGSAGRSLDYADSTLRQMFGDEAPAKLEWATVEQLRKVVAALHIDARRRARREN